MRTIGKELLKEMASLLRDDNKSGLVALTHQQAKLIRLTLKSYDNLLTKLDGDWSQQTDDWTWLG
jgi:hypothetical protein